MRVLLCLFLVLMPLCLAGCSGEKEKGIYNGKEKPVPPETKPAAAETKP